MDLEVPIIYGDNEKGQNRIMVPDQYNFANYFDTHVRCKAIHSQNQVPWEQKQNRAYFRGMPSGKWFDNQGYNIDRPKLVIDAKKHPDMVEARFNGFFPNNNLYG